MTAPTSRSADLSELVMALLLGGLGVAIALDAHSLKIPYAQSDTLGPRAVPYIVAGVLLLSAALLAVEVLRGNTAESEAGEDVDADAPVEWRTIGALVAVLVANVLLINTLGWVISGAMLFFGSVVALGSRSYLRDLVISVVLALVSFYGFYSGLGILLPAGPLEGVL